MSFDFDKPSSLFKSCVARILTKLCAVQAALQEAVQAKAVASAAAADAANAKRQPSKKHTNIPKRRASLESSWLTCKR